MSINVFSNDLFLLMARLVQSTSTRISCPFPEAEILSLVLIYSSTLCLVELLGAAVTILIVHFALIRFPCYENAVLFSDPIHDSYYTHKYSRPWS